MPFASIKVKPCHSTIESLRSCVIKLTLFSLFAPYFIGINVKFLRFLILNSIGRFACKMKLTKEKIVQWILPHLNGLFGFTSKVSSKIRLLLTPMDVKSYHSHWKYFRKMAVKCRVIFYSVYLCFYINITHSYPINLPIMRLHGVDAHIKEYVLLGRQTCSAVLIGNPQITIQRLASNKSRMHWVAMMSIILLLQLKSKVSRLF